MRDMNNVKSDFTDQGVEFLAVNVFEEPEDARSFIDSSGLDYSWMRADERTIEALGIKGVPTLIILDREGVVAWRSNLFTPFRGGVDLRQALEGLTGG
jgi:hypothetical protein